MAGVTRLPEPCLVVLVGPAGCGKSTWAARSFRPEQVISSDRLRAMVGTGEKDQRAGTAAFEVLDLVVDHRLRRRLTTVIDSTALEAVRRRSLCRAWRDDGESRSSPRSSTFPNVRCDGVTANVPTPSRRRCSPPSCAASAWRRQAIPAEGFDAVDLGGRPRRRPRPTPARRCASRGPPPTGGSDAARRSDYRCRASRGRAGVRRSPPRWRRLPARPRQAGFTSIWVMDHYLQIPQVGREWEEMLEAYTTLGYLAGRTTTARLGTLCTGITYRNVAALGKIIATLDVLSGGRAMAGLGIGWFEREHDLYGWEFPPRRAALRPARGRPAAAPAAVGQGIAAVRGPDGHRARGDLLSTSAAGPRSDPRRRVRRASHAASRRPLRRRLQLVRRRRDGASQGRGAPSALRRRRPRSRRGHGDQPDDGPGDQRRRRTSSADHAGTVDEQIGRYRAFAEAGVQTAIVSLADVAEGGIERFAPVIAAFR